MKLAPLRLHPRSAGSALTIALITVAMVVLLVVLALSIASSDRRVASNTLAQESARSLADAALSQVANQIASIPLDRHWAAAPGRLRIWNGSGWDQVDLHSGDGTGNTNPDESVDLNARLSDGTFPILPPNQEFPTAPEMRVRWIYVSEDGSTSTNAPASGVIGRYAYWADIENGRVNLNTAGLGMIEFNMPSLQNWVAGLATDGIPGPTQFLGDYSKNVWARNPWVSDHVGIDTNTGRPTFPDLDLDYTLQNTPQYLTAHPSSINLSYLDGVSEEEGFNTFRYAGSYFLRADALTSMLRGGEVVTGTEPTYWVPDKVVDGVDLSVRFFDAPEDWMRIVDADTFEANKGYLTVRGRTPEITPWGTPKLAISLAAREHANARNDLTETDHRRNARLLSHTTNLHSNNHWYQTLQDTRVVQLPAINPGHTNTFNASNAGEFHRLMIRDITAGNFASGQVTGGTPARLRSNPNRLSAIWGIRQHLAAGPLPGVPGTLATKYGASEADQIAVEMATFFDNQLSSQYPGRTRNLNMLAGGNEQRHFRGRRLPYVAPASGTIMRRLGSHGGPLLNKVSATASSLPVTQSGTNLQIKGNNVETLTKLASGSLTLSAKNFPRLSETVNGNVTNVCAVFMNPNWPVTTPPTPIVTTNANALFILVEFETEVFLPKQWSLRSRSPAYDMGDFRYSVFLNDVVCTVGGQTQRANSSTPSDGVNVSSQKNMFAELGSTLMPDSTPEDPTDNTPVGSMTPGTSLALTNTPGLAGVLIGPFSPTNTNVVNFTVKTRILMNHDANSRTNNSGVTQLAVNNDLVYASVVPGIFEDNLLLTQTNTTEVNDFLTFTFNNFNTAADSVTTVSLEAPDPRVTRRGGNWQSTPAPAPPANADLYRPDPLLQHVRGMLRTRIASDATKTSSRFNLETQSATRILGLPGVGYLSSIPTGVDAGIPWQTMKFQSTSDPVPDWMLWSLFYVPFDRSIHNQTDGKLNINATLWPWGIERARPLEALLGDRVPNPESLSRSIASAAGSGKSIGPDDMFVYPGQICQVPGVTGTAADETEKEALARDLADIITTQCDDYRVFIVAQPLRQAPDGTFTPIATARLEATISRTPDEGGGGFFFGPQAAGDLGVFTRASYQSGGTRGNRFNAREGNSFDPTPTHPNGFSHLGRDGLPNTDDDWLIPQKIQISHLRYLP